MKKPNYLLIGYISFIALYWSIAPFVARPYVRNMASILAILAIVAVLNRYLPTAYRILIEQDRDGDNGYIAILGTVTSAVGVAWTAFFSIIWIYYGQPPEWTATATSSFGFMLIALGKWMVSYSPDAGRIDRQYPIGFWRLVVMSFGLVLAYLAGAYFSNP